MKERTISLRVTEEWWSSVKASAEQEAKRSGFPISATALIELAVKRYIEGMPNGE